MRTPTTAELITLYRSYFIGNSILITEEVSEKILQWINRDYKHLEKEAKRLEERPRKPKAIFSWKGKGISLKAIFKLRNRIK